MISKSWSRRSALVCAVNLPACGLARAQAVEHAPPAPAIALLDSADAAQWQTSAKQPGWRVLVPTAAANASLDQRVLAVAAAVREAIRNSEVNPARVYLAGRGQTAAAVFYAIGRTPDLWAAGVALGGSPQPAIDSDRIFAANFSLTPVLWVGGGDADEALATKLKAAGLNLEYRSGDGLTNAAVFEWLVKHSRAAFPPEIDCETNSPNFASCYWIQMTKFDAGERNDVLASTRISGATRAALDLGAFGYSPEEPGPGVLVASLPEKYSGPLKTGDRIVELDGKPIENARQYGDLMAAVTQEQPAVVMVRRGKDRVRLETRIVVPRRDAFVTARVQAKYLPEEHTIQVVSRTVKEMRVTIPAEWAPKTTLYWNGLALENIQPPGCFLLTIDKELLRAAPCP